VIGAALAGKKSHEKACPYTSRAVPAQNEVFLLL